MNPLKIAVVGATGKLGIPVTKQLIKAGFDVTILSRSPEKAATIFHSTRIVQADLQDSASLQKALAGQQAIYLNLSIEQTEKQSAFHTESEGLKNLLAVAKQIGIQRISYLSSIVMRYHGMNGFRWWVFAIKQQAVQLIKDSGIPYLIFYPSAFMESFYIQIRGKQIGLVGNSLSKMWYIAGEDYGKQVVKAFEITPAPESKQYVIQGPTGYIADEAVKIFADNYPKQKLSVVKAPMFAIKLLGFFNQRMNYAAHICEALNKYPEKFVAEKTWQDLGTPTITVEAFARNA